MGRISLFVVLGVGVIFGSFSGMMNRSSSRSMDTYASYLSKTAARNANIAALEMALRRLADTTSWRSGYPNLTVAGTNVKVTMKDTTYEGSSAILLTSRSAYTSDTLTSHYDTLLSTVIVQVGFLPPVVRGALTAFGPLDKTISDMLIDGRDHDTVLVSAGPPQVWKPIANNGVYGISTGAATFTNNEPAVIGGSNPSTSPPTDYAPTYPENPASIEKAAVWPNGFPTNPDAALGWPAGTLKSIAKSGVNGSRYLTKEKQLDSLITAKKPLMGVTYIDVPASDTLFSKKKIPDNSGGILVFHCDTKTAYWQDINTATTGGTFKGLMIFDKMFHFHMNCIGAVVILTKNTVMENECHGNQDKVIVFSSKLVQGLVGSVAGGVKGGWRNKLAMKAWFE